MPTEIELRPGVVFRPDAAGGGAIEFAAGRRVENVSLRGTVPATDDGDAPAVVRVLSAVFPVSREQIARSERLPALAIIPVETQYLRSDRDILFALFQIPFAVDGRPALDPRHTVVLPMHGNAEVDERGRLSGGRPCLPAAGGDRWISLDPAAVATIVGWASGPDGQAPEVLINTGCFSSTPRGGAGPTFNEELAAVLARDGVAVYGPPHAGVVTAATWYGAWKNQFRQPTADGGAGESAIHFRRIAPRAAAPGQVRTPTRGQDARRERPVVGTLVITNDCSLAASLAAFSPDFSDRRPHGFDRTYME